VVRGGEVSLRGGAQSDELFLDLIVVGVVHRLADDAHVQVSGFSVVRFAVMFLPIWTMVADYRMFINAFGVYDIMQRLHSLLLMALIIGYMVNVTGVLAIDELGLASSYNNSAVHFSVAFFLVAKAIKSGLYLLYAIALPKFRFHMLFNFACGLIPIVVICSVLGTGNPVLFYSLIPCTKGWE